MALTRITITLPAELVRAADKAAKAQDRSRSWVVADALKRGLARPATQVREVAVAPYTAAPDAAAFEAVRLQHLATDLKLTPSERLHRIEGMGALVPTTHRGTRHQVSSFDTYDEFYAWKTSRRIAG
jgi:hypothetical protein